MDNLTTDIRSSFEKNLKNSSLFYQIISFAAVGLLNTALNFLIFNFISKAFGINQGWFLGLSSSFGFLAAVVQSYFWNTVWTFQNQSQNLSVNFFRLLSVGALGFISLLAVFFCSKISAGRYVYAALILVFLILQGALWVMFNFKYVTLINKNKNFFLYFFVSIVGLLINFILVSLISNKLQITGGDLDKNIAAVIATFASLIWNFIGYKAFVFNKAD